ncbi:uncharacterized protein with HEPN domain [Algoriphagus aquaeductus]|uniref:Uncharacterized protein with HEPN domain n=2 Tax=Cyclobacteriaceae TaxID=563798 RepID=A0A326RMK2_9BACT|nr:DUF86 domain-containing protein [Algoriphagus sp.]PZV76797.1 uncharacterized protein with HEPN domain [Algoriphagus aquaeductus]
MSRRDIDLLLMDMKESAEKILKYTEGLTYDDFLRDDKTIDAVVRNFEIIGEASIRIEDDFKLDHPQIEWKKLRGFRNRIVHEYFGIDYEIVWSIIESDLEELIFQLEEILKNGKEEK